MGFKETFLLSFEMLAEEIFNSPVKLSKEVPLKFENTTQEKIFLSAPNLRPKEFRFNSVTFATTVYEGLGGP